MVNNKWIHPLIAETYELAGLHSIEMYIWRRQQTIAQYISTHPILQLCTTTSRRAGSPPAQSRWRTSQLTQEQVETAEQLLGNYDNNLGDERDDADAMSE